MIDFAKLPNNERNEYLEETAYIRGLNRLIVEKDFWICFMLRILFSLPGLEDKFVFKGGTSLSKAFGIIKRFSEDIDISLDPSWLGFGGPAAPEKAPTRSGFNKRWEKLENKCEQTVKKIIKNQLEQAILASLNGGKSGAGTLIYENDKHTNSPVLVYNYPTDAIDEGGYIRPQVKLEFGSLTDQKPTGTHEVTPWVAEEFPDEFKLKSCNVVALEAERTFWEKATILHAEYHRPAGTPMRVRISRDLYDIACMSSHESGERAIANIDLFSRVVNFKQTFFRSSWASYETAKPGTLRLVPPEARIKELQQDYAAMQEMFFEAPPKFDDLIKTVKDLEMRING